MRHLATIRVRRFVAAVLALALSVCCCQAHLLLAGSSGAPVGAVAIDACCESGPDAPRDRPADAPCDDRSAPTGCQTCCVKGSGLKDDVTLAMPAMAALATLALPAVTLPAIARRPEAAAIIDPATLRVEPPTLLRLRCALVV